MAATSRLGLNASQMRLPIFCGGSSFVGFGLTGTWAGTVTFRASTDGILFNPVSVTPYPSGTTVQNTTANGNWFFRTQNYVAAELFFGTYTSGTLLATLAASVDGSYQDAFLAQTSQFVSQNVASGATNVITIAAQANRAWRCRTLQIGFSVAASAAVDIKITDGASSTLWEGFVPPSLNGISGGGFFNVPLPAPTGTPGVADGGVVGTVGNSMVITLAAPGGSVASTVNAEIIPA